MRIHYYDIVVIMFVLQMFVCDISGLIVLQEGYGIITYHIQRIYWWRSAYVMLQALSFDILFMWDRGSLGESP